MKTTLKSIALLVLLSLPLVHLHAQEKAETKADESPHEMPLSAFGYTLGEMLPKAKVLGKKGAKYQIEPLTPYAILQNYFVEITPDTRLIYRLDANGSLKSLKQAKDEAETLRKLLSEKYGSPNDITTLQKQRYLEYTHAKGVIRLGRIKKQVYLTYINYETMAQSNAEYQKQREIQKTNAQNDGQKKAFRDPKAL